MVSVVIPFYKGKRYIDKMMAQLEACYQYLQEKDNSLKLEAVLVNDDPTEPISIGQNISFQVEVVSNPQNIGIQRSRIEGLRRAKGDAIVFLDQDDYVKPEWAWRLCKTLDEGQTGYAVCNGYGRRFGPFGSHEFLKKTVNDIDFVLHKGNAIWSPGQVMMKKDAIPKAWQEFILSHQGADDYLLWLLVLLNGGKFSVCEEYLYYHNPDRTEFSVVSSEMRESEFEVFGLLKKNGYITDDDEKKWKESQRIKEKKRQISAETLLDLDELRKRDIQLADYFIASGYKNVAIYGLGLVGERVYELLTEKPNELRVPFCLDQSKDDFCGQVKVFHDCQKAPDVDCVVDTISNGLPEEIVQSFRHRGISVVNLKKLLADILGCKFDAIFCNCEKGGIYGTGKNAIVQLLGIHAPIILIDDAKAGTALLGHGIYTLEQAVNMGVKRILIAATKVSTEIVYTRIKHIAFQNGIEIYDLSGNQLDDQGFEEADLGNAKNALIIDQDPPKPDRSAGEKLSVYYMQAFKRLGYQVWFLPMHTGEITDLDVLKAEGIHIPKFFDRPLTWLSINGARFEVIFLQRPDPADFFREIIKENCKKATLIYHPADLHFQRFQREYQVTGNTRSKQKAEKYRKIEYDAIERSDLIYVVGSKEACFIRDTFPDKAVRDIPIFLYEEEDIPKRKQAEMREHLLFVGGFRHSPNVDAVKWLAEEIMPQVWKEMPEMKCIIVGGDIPEELLRFENEHFIYRGYVAGDELRSLYLESKVAIAPLRYGAGVKGKIVEAAYFGLPVITTEIGAEGIHDAEAFLTIADDPEAFAKAIIKVYRDAAYIDRVAKNSIEVIRKYYTREVAEKILREDLETWKKN